ncbi:MAG: helix-turn-helix transcriptional regulator [Bacteroidales bacterium]|nr:helix-turn-helix transcriptional regulator [Bacteroidales bacterium]
MFPLSSPLTLRQLDTVGYKETPPMPARAYAGWSLLYLISGEVLVNAMDTAFLVHAHAALLIPPGVPFRVEWYRNSIGYIGGFEEPVLKDRGYRVLQDARPVRVSFRAEDEGFMDELMLKLFRDQARRGPASACLDVFLQEVDVLLPSAVRNSLSNTFLDRVFDRSRPIGTVSSHAAALQVSPNYLNRCVKAHTGRSAREWIDISRLGLAQQLLRRKDLAIIDIATQVGLEDQSYFSRFFKRQTGMTPSEYRAELS